MTYAVARITGGGSVGGTCSTSVSGTSCTDAGLTPGTSYAWSVTPQIASWNGNSSTGTATVAGALSKFAVSAPDSSVAGNAINVTVTAQDSLGDTVTGYTGSPTLTSSDAQAVLPSAYAYVASDAGAHQFSVTFKTAGTQTVTATDGAATGTSAGTQVSAGPASAIAFTTQPGGAAPATVFTTQPKLTVRDAFGNTVTTDASSGSVVLSIKTGTGTAGAVLSGCAASEASGVISFTGCQIDKRGAGYQLHAVDGTMTADSSPFDNPTLAIGTISTNVNNGNGTINGTAPAGPVSVLICAGTATSCTGLSGTPTTSSVATNGTWSYSFNLAKNTQYTVTVTLSGASVSKTWSTSNATS